ncbi:MAG: hypothetical protein CVV64_19905 [Candidatus Wallbacteria bacterium HGW-Wallbacteria-1]|jgi:hypothetical protein|uniref:Uncharacterized protein n=1 Tax=Candidatus Wallbacteria bacterium HGW-Wallbacteria-1 TaxID=2013854 RepID=A0A2N1PIN5_9BACT|nr:MAG: hypothetical protein CVV64_19905 [Candidatus Wallbacteria bacterium HGW-Wallbacteria-1]
MISRGGFTFLSRDISLVPTTVFLMILMIMIFFCLSMAAAPASAQAGRADSPNRESELSRQNSQPSPAPITPEAAVQKTRPLPGKKFMVYIDGAMNRVLTNVPPWGQTWENMTVLSRGKTYKPFDPEKNSSPAGDHISNYLHEKTLRGLYMGEPEDAEEQASWDGPTQLGQRASNDENGLYMLVPMGWKGIRGGSQGLLFSYRSPQDPERDTEVIEVYKLLMPEGSVLDDFNEQVLQNVLKGSFDGATIDYTGVTDFRYGSARKTILKGLKGVRENLIVYIGLLAFSAETGTRGNSSAKDALLLTFQFRESNTVEYHVLFDALIESIYYTGNDK